MGLPGRRPRSLHWQDRGLVDLQFAYHRCVAGFEAPNDMLLADLLRSDAVGIESKSVRTLGASIDGLRALRSIMIQISDRFWVVRRCSRSAEVAPSSNRIIATKSAGEERLQCGVSSWRTTIGTKPTSIPFGGLTNSLRSKAASLPACAGGYRASVSGSAR